jgi:hypothetical protein
MDHEIVVYIYTMEYYSATGNNDMAKIKQADRIRCYVPGRETGTLMHSFQG